MEKVKEDLGTMTSGAGDPVTTGDLAAEPVERKQSRSVHDPFLNKTVEVSNKLTDRLRGRYANGPTMPNGEPEFGWREFPVPPIQKEAAAEIERLEALVYVPGQWRCAKCNFRLTQSNLYVASGTVGPRDEPGDKCPNCDGPLWRVSAMDDRNEAFKTANETFDRVERAEKRLEELERALSEAPTYKLMTHANQHGFGVSLTKYDHSGEMLAGFVIATFDSKLDRLKYLSELAPMTGFEIEHLND